jgi:hypothetical protein
LEHHLVDLSAGLTAAFTVSQTRPWIAATLADAWLEVDPVTGFDTAVGNRLAGCAGLDVGVRGAASALLVALWGVVLEEDLEVLRVAGRRVEVTLDDAAAFRHPDWSRFGFQIDPQGGPYLAKEHLIRAVDRGEAVSEATVAALPVIDAVVVRAYAEARGHSVV